MEIVILRRRLVMALLAMLGVAVVVLPTVAGSEVSPTIKAANTPSSGYYGESHAWSLSQATVSAGGVVTLLEVDGGSRFDLSLRLPEVCSSPAG